MPPWAVDTRSSAWCLDGSPVLAYEVGKQEIYALTVSGRDLLPGCDSILCQREGLVLPT